MRGRDMKFISWNVNGIRACVQKGIYRISFRKRMQIFSAFRRAKMQEGQLDLDTPEDIISTGIMP